jgi:oligopeptide transport system substrate-binding protein
MKSKGYRFIALFLSLILMGGCLGGASAASDTFTFVNAEPNTLNMTQSASNLDSYVFYLVSSMLFRSYKGVVTAELCDTMTVSQDRCTYTYTIKDAVYADGQKITARDFAYYMLKGYIRSENASWFVGGQEYYDGTATECAGVYAVDDKTFVVTLVKPLVAFDGKLEIYPLQQAFAESKGEALGGTPADLMYSGPYVLTEWVHGSYMTFVKNPSYLYAASSFPTQNIKLVVSMVATTSYSMYQSGEVDMLLTVNEENYSLLSQDCHYALTGAVQGFEFNTVGFSFDGSAFVERDPKVVALLQNINFRKALSYALDRETLVAATNFSATPTNRFVAANATGNSPDSLFVNDYPLNAVPLAGDAAMARDFLTAALADLGYANISQLPKISYLTFENETYKVMGEAIVDQWKQVLGLENINIELQPINSAVMRMVFMNYDIYWQSLTVNQADPTEFLNYWTSAGGVADAMGTGAPPYSNHFDPAYDAIVSASLAEFDTVARMKLVSQAEQMLADTGIYNSILLGGAYTAVKPYVSGFTWYEEDNGYDFNELIVNK